jgi:hypothetical protein
MIDKELEEWLSDSPIEWDYWQYGEDFDALRKWYGADAGPDRLWAYQQIQRWYEAAIAYDIGKYHAEECAVNFSDWSNAFWTIQQATALVLGKNPDQIEAGQIEEDSERSLFAWYYHRVQSLISEAQIDKRLPDPIRPRILIEWANGVGINYPDGIENAIPVDDKEADDYRWMYMDV